LLESIERNKTVLFRKGRIINANSLSEPIVYGFSAVFGLLVIIIAVNFICSPIFNAKSYQTRISVNEDGNFTEDIKEVDFNQLPLLDKASSQVLGDRVMGQMSELVSQYRVSDLYTQINYNNSILRVTPLEYADGIKWFTNRKNGIVGYITVDSVTGESNLVRLEKGMKYSTSAMFNEKLERKLRFDYPTTNFGRISFEIDNEGNPYYIIPTIKYTAVGLKAKVTGVIIFDPITGESKKYKNDEIPTWVDIAYSASLIIEQVDDWGTYKNGFFNSIFGQKNVVNTTDGYNYLAMNDDIYLYTGITSVVSDESNLGFILTNMRTGETTYYNVPGAEEYSAMSSAEGQVQDMGYKSTFPLLINLNGKPTYLVSLKDSSGLVKMYGFVDVKDYQKVVVTDSSKGIIVAKDNYLSSTKKEAQDDELVIEEIKVESINTAIINGYTNYYVSSASKKFIMSFSFSDNLPFINYGDTFKVGYY
ncbi:MAG: CvpA family protein, partial [Bacilli bacterium]|nr:CvpA family protein [Bacilli bacterium]